MQLHAKAGMHPADSEVVYMPLSAEGDIDIEETVARIKRAAETPVRDCPIAYNRLILVSYSWGGANLLKVVEGLSAENIKTDLIATIDLVPKPHEGDPSIDVSGLDASYGSWFNIYQQTDASSRFLPRLIRLMGHSTTLVEQYRTLVDEITAGRAPFGILGRRIEGPRVENDEITLDDFKTAYPYFGLPAGGAQAGHLFILGIVGHNSARVITDQFPDAPLRSEYRIKAE